MIFAFYSFKGGVGRSMMLANAAEHLSRRGLNVLMVDFDLEAPGLERFFCKETPNSLDPPGPNPVPLPDHAQLVASRGVVDLLISFKTLQSLPPPTQQPPSSEAATELATEEPSEEAPGLPPGLATGSTPPAVPPSFPFHVEPLANFIVPIYAAGDGSLSLMTAGRRDDNEYSLYAERVRTFDWDEFYAQYHGAQFFSWFGEQLKRYDVVLIDSRTGITEMSGICTHQLADAVVLFVAANDQNLEGTRRMADSLLRRDLVGSRGGRPLSVLIVPSRVELAEGQKLKDFSDRFTELAEKRNDDRITFSNGVFLDLRVPYIPFYAYGERVAVREPELPIAADLIAATTRICSAIIELVPNDSPVYSRYQSAQANLPKVADASFDKPPPDFTGRDWVFAAIAAWLVRPSTPIMLVVGASGSGKTALASRLVTAADQHTSLAGGLRPSGQLVVAHSCRLDDGWRPFLEKLVRAFAVRWPAYVAASRRAVARIRGIVIEAQSPISGEQSLQSIRIEDVVSPEVAFQALVRQPLDDIARSGAATEPALVLIDGLDEVLASNNETLADLLAVAVKLGWPAQMKLLILSHPDSRVLRLSHELVDLGGDPGAARPDLVAYAERRLAGRVGPQELKLLTEPVADAAAGNFRYARAVLDAALEPAMESAAIVATLERLLASGEIPPGLQRAYSGMVQREVGFNTERWSSHYRPVLGLLAVADEGFTADELAAITGQPRSEISDNLRLVQRLVIEFPASRRFRLFHPSFATFLLIDTEYGVSAVEARETIAGYFVHQHAEHWDAAPDLAVRDTDRFLVAAIAATTDRHKARDLAERLAELLLDQTFLAAKLARGGSADLRKAIEAVVQAVQSTEPRRETLRRLSDLLRGGDTELLTKLREDRRWLPAQLAPPGNGVALGNPTPSDMTSQGASPPEATFSRAGEPSAGPVLPTPEEEETVRRRIPIHERVALARASRAKRTGLIILCLSLWLTGVLAAGRYLTFWGYFPSDLLIAVYAVTLFGLIFFATVAARSSGMSMAGAAPGAAIADWERLPEILALRSQRPPYRLLGDLAMASPYFEITLAILLIGGVVGTVSAPVELWRLVAPYR